MIGAITARTVDDIPARYADENLYFRYVGDDHFAVRPDSGVPDWPCHACLRGLSEHRWVFSFGGWPSDDCSEVSR
jgi:hypothetical protein